MALNADANAAGVQERFSAINLHDCRVTGIRARRRPGATLDDVELGLELLTGAQADQWIAATMTFSDCAYASIAIDFWGKRACGDSIDDARCERDTQHVDSLLAHDPIRAQMQPASELFIFSIVLCPPGGEIAVVARDFSLI